eukprot:TRINITY_DN68793_c0_g1_i1.p1 TRINITY_DN68793_c0_g1~~TRINITY_DN68793_c0_g1_i1.p1  ORF type:complete len:475 (-),score=81.51 TRINITY_DN68793_c0_g1_i1:128-1552(-)
MAAVAAARLLLHFLLCCSSGGLAATLLGSSAGMSPGYLSRLESMFGVRKALLRKRFEIISTAVRPDFVASPLNSLGRLNVEDAKPLVRGYFARTHGWVLRGLEPPDLTGATDLTKKLHGVHILQDGDPPFASLLREASTTGRGLSEGDACAVVVALEWLILRRSLELLDAAYALNGFSVRDALSEDDLHKVLQSYLLVFREGSKADLIDDASHRELRGKALEDPAWGELVDFESDAVAGHLGMRALGSPSPSTLDRQEVEEILIKLALQYGSWQNSECKQMKADLKAMDKEGSGTVSLEDFHNFPADQRYGYRFSESIEHLVAIGALVDVRRVLIANYIHGPSNCIATSAYVAVCCLNACEGSLSELEKKTRAPRVRPARLLRTMTEVVPEHSLLESSKDSLFAIAKANDGGVPLRSESFARWLHKVLPYDCPRPRSPELESGEAEISADGEVAGGALNGGFTAESPGIPLYMV